MTTTLAKGQNAPLPVTDVVVSVQVGAAADLSALLVKADGKVRSEADFVFYNQPSGPGVDLTPGSGGQPGTLAVSLGRVPADITTVRAVVTLDDASSTFRRAGVPVARVADTSGTTLFEFVVEGLDTESIVIALELYRRGDDWKVRAVGQGYAGGFAALVTDHGIEVEEPAAPATPAPAPSAPLAPPAAAPSAEPGLTQGRPVSLVKGQRVSLRKEGGVALTTVRMGLGWDPVTTRGRFGNRTPDIDLDASAVMCADSGIVDVVYYGQLTSKDGSMRHAGDNLTGEGEGDDEVIAVDLSRVPVHATTILFVVTSYKGHTFEQVSNAFCRLVDATTNAELARYTLSGGEAWTGMVMAKVYRSGDGWKMQAIGEGITAKHVGEAAPQLVRFVGA